MPELQLRTKGHFVNMANDIVAVGGKLGGNVQRDNGLHPSKHAEPENTMQRCLPHDSSTDINDPPCIFPGVNVLVGIARLSHTLRVWSVLINRFHSPCRRPVGGAGPAHAEMLLILRRRWRTWAAAAITWQAGGSNISLTLSQVNLKWSRTQSVSKRNLKHFFIIRHSVLTNSRCFSFSGISITYRFSCLYCNALLDFIP